MRTQAAEKLPCRAALCRALLRLTGHLDPLWLLTRLL
jgi:hypothetical protein